MRKSPFHNHPEVLEAETAILHEFLRLYEHKGMDLVKLKVLRGILAYNLTFELSKMDSNTLFRLAMRNILEREELISFNTNELEINKKRKPLVYTIGPNIKDFIKRIMKNELPST